MKPELISFNICPYVERSVITLAEKGVDFDITYIDVYDPPVWFRDISPLGKVPVLRYGDAVIFESAIINEFLDEITPPPLHPTDPLTRAQHRG
ncbi:MAG: glutathione S-transferase family protein [Gammaproteobacteria bacterium]|nr:glutathione S-transferase family protein [Gammaproteobacteria bacterium]